jgi:hypothetical protein
MCSHCTCTKDTSSIVLSVYQWNCILDELKNSLRVINRPESEHEMIKALYTDIANKLNGVGV